MNFSKLFELRGKLDKKTDTIIAIIGFGLLLSLWQLTSVFKLVPVSILPPPLAVLKAFIPLHLHDALIRNCIYSLKLNIFGYAEAVAIALPIGMVMGLIPVVRSAMIRYFAALRFLPMAACTGLFISWFHLTDNMKIQFLAASIIVYLVPVVVQRVDDVENVYIHTAYTLGASKLQTIISVYIPSVMSKIIEDIGVLVAISWTYITIAEALNMNAGGIGALAVQCGRRSDTDAVFAVLLLIMIIGVAQDRCFKKLDKIVNPHKYN
jgi:NitT/TauT family transport system permease protein